MVNDSAVRCQSQTATEPAGEKGGTRSVTDEELGPVATIYHLSAVTPHPPLRGSRCGSVTVRLCVPPARIHSRPAASLPFSHRRRRIIGVAPIRTGLSPGASEQAKKSRCDFFTKRYPAKQGAEEGSYATDTPRLCDRGVRQAERGVPQKAKRRRMGHRGSNAPNPRRTVARRKKQAERGVPQKARRRRILYVKPLSRNNKAMRRLLRRA